MWKGTYYSLKWKTYYIKTIQRSYLIRVHHSIEFGYGWCISHLYYNENRKKGKKLNEIDDSYKYEYYHSNIGLRKILKYMKHIFQYFLFIWNFWRMGIKIKQLSFQHRFRTRRMFGRWQWWYKPRWAFWGRIIVRIIEAFRY